jgi:hypothetical protein
MILVLNHQHVGKVDASGFDAYEHFTFSGSRRRNVLDREIAGQSVALHNTARIA